MKRFPLVLAFHLVLGKFHIYIYVKKAIDSVTVPGTEGKLDMYRTSSKNFVGYVQILTMGFLVERRKFYLGGW